MLSSRDSLTDAFPFLTTLPGRGQESFSAHAVRKSLDDGQILVGAGNDCAYLPFVMSGSLRIYKISESGKELTLYRIARGESCILTTTCILNGNSFPAIAQAEGPTDVVLIPSRLFVGYVEEYPQWRRFVFGLYSKRLEMVLTLVEEVAFRHVDSRIAAFLLKNASVGENTVERTHQQIASEVGTSREVVSRILKDFETAGIVATLRAKIKILDPGGLEKRAEESNAV
jgi:CRP/FNR family transcriptional regulator